MLRCCTYLICLLVVVPPATAQPPAKPVRLTIHPAAPPTPALNYQLLPEAQDLQPGNAAQLYYRAYSPEWDSWLRRPGVAEKIAEALHVPLPNLGKDLGQLKDSVLKAANIRELDLAARREYVDWALVARARADGVNLLLPDVQGFRQFASVLALRARLHLADGQYDKAAYSLQTGFALGRHVADAPLLITGLVGIAVVHVQLGQVEQWVQTPGSPNLYWALTDLPQPLIDLRRSLQGERLWLAPELPQLHDLETADLSAPEAQKLLDQLVRLVRLTGEPTSAPVAKAKILGLALKFYPEAKRSLIAAGRKPEQVEALPMFQVYALHALHEYRRFQDDLFKWWALPYAEGRPGMERVEKELAAARERLEAVPFLDFLPAAHKVYTARARLDRRVAALRCVEAIRLYAAAHDGQLPATLGDITEVPLPLDPMTGKAFEYTVSGDKATLHGAALQADQVPLEMLTYELTLQR